MRHFSTDSFSISASSIPLLFKPLPWMNHKQIPNANCFSSPLYSRQVYFIFLEPRQFQRASSSVYITLDSQDCLVGNIVVNELSKQEQMNLICKNFFLDFPLFICVYSCHQHHLYLLLNSLFAYVYLFLSISYVATGLTAVVVTCPHALVVIGRKVVSWLLQKHLLLSSLCPIWASLSMQTLIKTKLPS